MNELKKTANALSQANASTEDREELINTGKKYVTIAYNSDALKEKEDEIYARIGQEVEYYLEEFFEANSEEIAIQLKDKFTDIIKEYLPSNSDIIAIIKSDDSDEYKTGYVEYLKSKGCPKVAYLTAKLTEHLRDSEADNIDITDDLTDESLLTELMYNDNIYEDATDLLEILQNVYSRDNIIERDGKVHYEIDADEFKEFFYTIIEELGQDTDKIRKAIDDNQDIIGELTEAEIAYNIIRNYYNNELNNLGQEFYTENSFCFE